MSAGIRKLVSVGAMLFCALLVFGAPVVATGETPSEPRPVDTEAPKLAGTPLVGRTLSCSQGAWEGSPTGYTYTWLRNGSPMAGQTGNTYVVQIADWGASISCQVTASNGGGEYMIGGLPSGSYSVEFSRGAGGGNYERQSYSGPPVSVTPPGTTSGINVAMSAGGQITGKVTSASDGFAAANVEVFANGVGAGGSANTNASGEYTISGLSTGSYTVEFDPFFEGLYLRQFARDVSVAAGSTTSGIDAVLPIGGKITGRVTKSGGTGLANINVCAANSEGGECGTTNANGEYTISGLPSGSYYVDFSPGGEGGAYLSQLYEGGMVAVAAGSTTLGINTEMHPGGVLTGKVTAAAGGATLANVEVCAEGRTIVLRICTTTSATGEYAFSGIPSGSYGVHFSPEYGGGHYREGGNYLPQYYDDTTSYSEAEVVSVVAGGAPTSGVDAELVSGGQITGMVTAAAGGTALANIRVCLGEPPVSEGFSCAITNSEGEYTIWGLSSGSYDVQFSRGGYDEVGNNYLTQSDYGVSVTAGSTTTGIDAAMATGGQITGRVTAAASGAALANIEVCVRGNAPELFGCAITNGGGGSTSSTSNALTVPSPNSDFSMIKPPAFDAKTGDLEFYFTLANAGTLRWDLSFKNADVGFIDALRLSLDDVIGGGVAGANRAVLATAEKKGKRCKAGFISHKDKCVPVVVPFASNSKTIPAGTVEVEVHAGAKALNALKAGHTLRVSGIIQLPVRAGRLAGHSHGVGRGPLA